MTYRMFTHHYKYHVIRITLALAQAASTLFHESKSSLLQLWHSRRRMNVGYTITPHMCRYPLNSQRLLLYSIKSPIGDRPSFLSSLLPGKNPIFRYHSVGSGGHPRLVPLTRGLNRWFSPGPAGIGAGRMTSVTAPHNLSGFACSGPVLFRWSGLSIYHAAVSTGRCGSVAPALIVRGSVGGPSSSMMTRADQLGRRGWFRTGNGECSSQDQFAS